MHATTIEQYKAASATCQSCADICNMCSDDMIGMESHGNRELMARCIRLCRECADICSLSANWLSRLSLLSDQACSLCAEVCDACAEACEQHAPHHKLCGLCAVDCRKCAEVCRDMAAAAHA
jgi:Domain of Unknown Function (DUF326)